MSKLSMIPMRIRTACEALEKELHRGSKGVIINTEFGTLGVEFHKAGMMIDPLHSISIVPWNSAPGTFWVKSMRDEHADYYICIEVYLSQITDHFAIIEALSRAMMMRLGFDNPSEKVVNALINCYTSNYDPVDETVDTLMEEYMCNYMGQFTRKRVDVQLVVREMITSKQELAKEVIRAGEMLTKELQQEDGNFYDLYSKQIWGIYLYALQEDQQSLSTKIKNIVDIANLEMRDIFINSALLTAVNK